MSDPLRELQVAAQIIAEHINPGHPARRVIVLGENGVKVLDTAVPLCARSAAGSVEPPAIQAGWQATERGATFDGSPVPVKGRGLDVLRVLVAGDVVTLDDLRAAWGDYKAEESTIRWQVGELRKALKKAFGDFPGEVIESTGAGYRLVLR